MCLNWRRHTRYRSLILDKLLTVTKYISYFVILGFCISYMGFLAAYMYAWRQLPDVETLKEVKLQTPMRVYTREGLLIGEFGEEHRVPISIEKIPERLNQAFIATEDKRFYEHG